MKAANDERRLTAAIQQRDSAREDVAICRRRISRLRAQVEALREYTAHRPGCAAQDGGDCTCGLATADSLNDCPYCAKETDRG